MASVNNYLISAAIDFGTTFSGYAFSSRHSFTTEPTNVCIKQWVDGLSRMVSNKTSTCALFDNEKNLIKFGFDAEEKYLDILMDKKENEFYLFRRFKMSLYNVQTNTDKMILEDVNGRRMPAIDVFSASIGYLKDSLLEDCSNQHTDIQITDIKWVITVPAIWTDSAKILMRTAAEQAGKKSEFLTIALEPEAAAMCVKYLPLKRQIDGQAGDRFQTFARGSKYLILDAGGGTVDITAHEVLKDGKVKELLTASGGNWGGTRVDESYMSFIEDLIGQKTMKKIQDENKTESFEIFRDFEITKRNIRPHSDDRINANIPNCITEAYKMINKETDLRKDAEVKLKNGKIALASFIGNKLRFDSQTGKRFFEESVSCICNHLSKVFKDCHGRHISTIIMVGGYSESPVLINAIRSTFSNKRVIVPHDAAWCVMKGAVIFGHDPGLISERRSKYTYGMLCSRLFEENVHDESKKFEIDGEIRCKDIFSKHVEIDQIIPVLQYQSDVTYRVLSNFSFQWSVFASKSKNPKYVTDEDCFKIGVVKVEKFPITPKTEIRVQMSFSHTEIEVKMTNTYTKISSKLYLKFDSDKV